MITISNIKVDMIIMIMCVHLYDCIIGTDSESIPFRSIISDRVLIAHNYQDIADYDAYDAFIKGTIGRKLDNTRNGIYLVCSSLNNTTSDSLNRERTWIDSINGCSNDSRNQHSFVAYYDKQSSCHCYLTHTMGDISKDFLGESELSFTKFLRIPSFLKIDQSILEHFTRSTTKHTNHHKDIEDFILNRDEENRLYLSIAITSCLDYDEVVYQGILDMIQTSASLTLLTSFGEFVTMNYEHLTWFSILKSRISNLDKTPFCDMNVGINYRMNAKSIDVFDVHMFSSSCLLNLIHLASLHERITSISINKMPFFLNYDAAKIIQGDIQSDSSYHDFGLTGKGQICGLADSGINDISCFFIDDSKMYSTSTTNRSGVLEEHRRKIIQYMAYADSLDIRGGHGTHVAASISGNSLCNFTEMNGIAPDGKIAFADIGITDGNYLVIPTLETLFDWSYNVGARVHSDSWGTYGGMYGPLSYDIDRYTHNHPDFLVVMAAGNFGSSGVFTIISPGNAKNTLTVGAAQVHDVFSDDILIPNQQSSIASFSSIGPTYDGRLKPEIVAPGDYIISAYAGSPDDLNDALSPDWNGSPSCSVHQMSGTSMATPIVAGTALLIRQYFADPIFWAKYCDKSYYSCRNGEFDPSGYFMKATMIHAGSPVNRYSQPIYDDKPTFFPSFELSDPPDVFQGYGQILLKNILPLYDKDGVRTNIGLDPRLELIVYDKLILSSNTTLRFDVDIVDSADKAPLKVTIAWYDPPSPISFVRKLLIHDVDLLVIDPYGRKYLGNRPLISESNYFEYSAYENENVRSHDKIINETESKLHFEKITADDRNPQEQVYISKPACRKPYFGLHDQDLLMSPPQLDFPCRYSILINSNILSTDTQDIALIVTTSGKVSGPMLVAETNDESASRRSTFLSQSSTKIFDFDSHISLTQSRFVGEEKNASNLLRELPTPIQTIMRNVIANDVSQSKTQSLLDAFEVIIPCTELNVQKNPSTEVTSQYDKSNRFSPKVARISSFAHYGRLEKVEIRLDGYSDKAHTIESKGIMSYLLSVSISSPNGVNAQIGGYNWHGVNDDKPSYMKRWADPWIGKSSKGEDWIASRFTFPAGLQSCLEDYSYPEDLWTVDIAIGFTLLLLPPLNFSGTLILWFDTFINCSEESAFPSKIPTLYPSISSPLGSLFLGNGSNHYQYVEYHDNKMKWSPQIILLWAAVSVSLITIGILIFYYRLNQGRLASNNESKIYIVEESANLLSNPVSTHVKRTDEGVATTFSRRLSKHQSVPYIPIIDYGTNNNKSNLATLSNLDYA